jgi:two-component system OmpR family response regulator
MPATNLDRPAKILVVDDEIVLREMLADALRIANFETCEAADAAEALKVIRTETPDLVVCDINMPGDSGYDLLQKLRESSNETPVILLTARSERADITQGLKLGADDYLTKPFGLEELLLRVKAVLKRTLKKEDTEAIICGPIRLHDDYHQVLVDGAEIDLSPTEYDLLKTLMESKNKVLSRRYLLREVWGIDFETESNVVDTYISYLRRKLRGANFGGIRTVRGVGFLISDKP